MSLFESFNAEVEAQRAQTAALKGAQPCPVCGMKTPSVRSLPPCYVPYSGRREDCHVFAMEYPEDFPGDFDLLAYTRGEL